MVMLSSTEMTGLPKSRPKHKEKVKIPLIGQMGNHGISVKPGKQSKKHEGENTRSYTYKTDTRKLLERWQDDLAQDSRGNTRGANEGTSQMGTTQTQETNHSTIKIKQSTNATFFCIIILKLMLTKFHMYTFWKNAKAARINNN